jgi:hypothetical protein
VEEHHLERNDKMSDLIWGFGQKIDGMAIIKKLERDIGCILPSDYVNLGG